MTRVVFVLTPRLHLLDLAGPAQVFSTATDLGHSYDLHYVAAEPVVPTHQGVPLQAATAWPALTPDDLVVVPGWRSPLASGEFTADMLARLAGHHARGAEHLGRTGEVEQVQPRGQHEHHPGHDPVNLPPVRR